MSIFDSLEKKLDGINNTLLDQQPAENSKLVGRQAYLTDPYLEVSSSQGSYRQKFSKLSNKLLREASVRDSIMSAVIRHRRTQVESFCNIPNTRFDTGFTWVRRDGQELQPDDHSELSMLSSFLYFCGDVSATPYDDKSTMATQIGMLVQDALVFGHVAIEKIRDKTGGLQRFRHVPAESIFHATKNMSRKQIELQTDTTPLANNQRDGVVYRQDQDRPVKWLQIIESQEVASFTDQTMTFKLYQPPSFIDNNGYSTSLVEACILSITRHLQAENYNSLFFTHGFAARGLLHLKGNVSQSNLQLFRNQFNSVINGNNNSWRTPIIAGLDDVDWIPLAGTSRDMEYIQYTDHLIRTICAQAMIDPTEIGFEYLSKGTQQSTLNSPNNEWKLTASQERGLIPLLRFFEDLVNHDIVPELDKGFSEKYMFKFIGLQSENRQQEITRLQAEMTVHSTLNELLTQVRKDPIDVKLGGTLPLNQVWWGMVKELLTVGELKEMLLGEKGASQKPEYQYIPSQMFMSWQNVQSQQKQMDMQKQQQDHQQQQEKAQQAQAEEQQAGINKQAKMSGETAKTPEIPNAQ